MAKMAAHGPAERFNGPRGAFMRRPRATGPAGVMSCLTANRLVMFTPA